MKNGVRYLEVPGGNKAVALSSPTRRISDWFAAARVTDTLFICLDHSYVSSETGGKKNHTVC